jgi:hypothetical protein
MIDAHAFLYFGDGQSVKFHSGRYKPDGGALMIGKEGIEGWWGAPDLKTDVTERASGNGGHDVAADQILYASRTVTVNFDAIGDVRSEVLDAVTRVSRANGLPVRFRVVDGMSDTFVSGFIRPQFGSGWNERYQTGTLTIVCPRPERLAWSPLQSQLFPVSAVQGGLRYSTVHQLVSAWLGTADASASTLSKDGSVIATNSFTDPNATIKYDILNGTASSVDGKWKYTSSAADVSAVYSIFPPSLPVGTVIYYKLSADTTIRTTLQNASLLGQNEDGERWWSIDAMGDHAIFFVGSDSGGSGIGQSITLERVGEYTPSDYAAMQELGIGWFSGDSYPAPTGKGLSYPLNYGTGGSASNVALLINQGSSKAYPVLTVTGSFPNGVQVQWGGNALQYDGAVGAVPLILDSRSQTASMGGVDVSRNLSRRDFPTVPAGGSVSLRLMSAGTGWVTAVCRDTYI